MQIYEVCIGLHKILMYDIESDRKLNYRKWHHFARMTFSGNDIREINLRCSCVGVRVSADGAEPFA